MNARISVREDEPVKLICNSIHRIDEFMAQNPAPKKDERPASAPAAVPSEPRKKIRKMYLKVPGMSGDIYTKVIATVKIFNGPVPLVLYNTEDGKYYSAPESMSVSEDGAFISYLKDLLGDSNVVIK